METTTMTSIAERLGVSRGFLSNVFAGRRRPSPARATEWERITGINIHVWLFASGDEIRRRLFEWARRA